MVYRILHMVGGMDKGGTETMLMNIYRKLDRTKVQFDFLYTTNKKTYYDNEILNLGGKIIRINNASKFRINKFIGDISNCIEKNGPYKAIHAHTLFNSGIVMLAGKKNNIDIRISHAHTTADNEEGIIRKIYINLMRKLILNNSTNLLACSDLAGEYLFGVKHINSDKYTILPNLVAYEDILNIDIDKVKKFKQENNIDGNDIVLGHIGTFKESKNQKYLLQIAKYLKDNGENIKLLLIGDGYMRSELEFMCSKLDITENVIFTGVRDDIDVILHSMDVFVFPSTFEGLGLVLLEAQAAGLPCVVSEAIQPEADLGLGLFNKLKLDSGIATWGDRIVEVSSKKEIDVKKIEEAFDKKGYSTEKCISKLLSIYKIDK